MADGVERFVASIVRTDRDDVRTFLGQVTAVSPKLMVRISGEAVAVELPAVVPPRPFASGDMVVIAQRAFGDLVVTGIVDS